MVEASSNPSFDFAVTHERHGDGPAIVSVSGEVDIFTAPELKTTLGAAIDGGATKIVVDLSETRFMDSTALGVLIGVVKKLRPLNGRMTVVNTEPSTAKTFQITGLDRIFSIVESREEALDALTGDEA